MSVSKGQTPGVSLSGLASLGLVAIGFFQLQNEQKSSTEAEKYAHLERQQHVEYVALQKERWRVQSEEAKESVAISQAPVLTVAQCCNQVPIRLVRVEGSRDSFIRLRKLDSNCIQFSNGYSDMKSRTENAYVAKIVNFGNGPAIGSKVYWEIAEVVSTDGQSVKLSAVDLKAKGFPFTCPASIAVGESAIISHIPCFLECDHRLSVSHAKGSIRIVCADSQGRRLEFRQSFTLDTVYSPQVYDPVGQRLSFHFLDPTEHATSHTAAKPLSSLPR